MPEIMIPATVIGSWSFPGWFEKFIADVKAQPDMLRESEAGITNYRVRAP